MIFGIVALIGGILILFGLSLGLLYCIQKAFNKDKVLEKETIAIKTYSCPEHYGWEPNEEICTHCTKSLYDHLKIWMPRLSAWRKTLKHEAGCERIGCRCLSCPCTCGLHIISELLGAPGPDFVP